MEIVIKGEGEVVIRFVDHQGRTWIERRFVTSGSSGIQAKTTIPLILETVRGQVPLIPILVRQGDPKLQITFDGEDPSSFSRKRCHEIGGSASVAEDVALGCARSVELSQVALPSPDISAEVEALKKQC